jgi:hypothetical protein
LGDDLPVPVSLLGWVILIRGAIPGASLARHHYHAERAIELPNAVAG